VNARLGNRAGRVSYRTAEIEHCRALCSEMLTHLLLLDFSRPLHHAILRFAFQNRS